MGQARRFLNVLVVSAVGVCALTSCGPPPVSEGGFDAPDPASKLYAIHRAGAQRDATAIPKLIEQLQNDDPAVRQFANHALKQITERDYGFNHWAADVERQAAIERWVEAYQSGALKQSVRTADNDTAE